MKNPDKAMSSSDPKQLCPYPFAIFWAIVLTGLSCERSVAQDGVQNMPETLGRIAFWVPPARMAEFKEIYLETVQPLLSRHGLIPVPESGWAAPDSVFAQFFAFVSPSGLLEKRNALQEDTAWIGMLEAKCQHSGVTYVSAFEGHLYL